MKHLGFTIQFLLLLIAIPLLMYVELTRDDKKHSNEAAPAQVEVAFTKKAPASVDHMVHSFSLIN